jgi:hypothetical protein
MAKNALFLTALCMGAIGLIAAVFPAATKAPERVKRGQIKGERVSDIVQQLDASMAANWRTLQIAAMKPAPELMIARRLALSLMGTVPSLEEIRRFEAQPKGQRVGWYLQHIFGDRRYADYLAERMTRATVGVKDGPFLVYRRRRYRAWLSEQFASNKSYGKVVHEMIATTGVWTDKPATNFLTVELAPEDDRPQPVPLAGRVSRTFIGIRMDCAECHDHPFENWQRKDFHGLAAFFNYSRNSLLGIHDLDKSAKTLRAARKKAKKEAKRGRPAVREIGEYFIEKNDKKTEFKPSVPFYKELLPASGARRERLASWVTHKENQHFARATVNRFWAFMFGRPLLEPVDDLPTEGPFPPPLEILARDFADNNHDLQRLITIIAFSKAFQMNSRSDPDDLGAPEITEDHELHFATFPLTQLRPEQVVGSLIQSASISTIDNESFWLWRFIRVTQENEFLKRYGDTGEDKFESGVGTIPQRLLLMNGKIVRERTKGELINSSGRIAMLAKDDAKAIESIWLCTFTRRPSKEELEHFKASLKNHKKSDSRARILEDIQWTLVNSTEFSWNH